MYATHNPQINEWCQRSADNTADMVCMVVLSIQQRWDSVGKQLESVRAEGADSRFLWGNKAKTYAFLQAHKQSLFDELYLSESPEEVMETFLQVPGLGLPKAGFATQLYNGGVGCIDSHNLKRLNIPETVLKISMSASDTTIQRRIQAYVDACAKRRSEWLWNTWCNLIAKQYPNKWADAHAVSQAHVTYLTGE